MTAALGVIPSRLLTGAEHGSGILSMPKVGIACFSNNLRAKALSPERRSAELVELKRDLKTRCFCNSALEWILHVQQNTATVFLPFGVFGPNGYFCKPL
ncbi:MAG: hypothetical protein ACLQKA_09920 [Bryobacteraceae bacterium]